MRRRYVARAEAGKGWRVWNRKTKRPWGHPFPAYPAELLEELNGPRRQLALVAAAKRLRNR